jgi:acetyl-CoA carboxylase biotin carboxyl carrier protein
MEIKDIKELIKALDQSSISKLEFVQGDQVIMLEKEKKEAPNMFVPAVSPVSIQGAPVAPVGADGVVPSVDALSQSVVEEKNIKSAVDVLAPLVGVFYSAASPDADPFVEVGQVVNEGDTLCILEAMKVLNEIKATKSGKVAAIHAANGDVVEFNQVLMEIK